MWVIPYLYARSPPNRVWVTTRMYAAHNIISWRQSRYRSLVRRSCWLSYTRTEYSCIQDGLEFKIYEYSVLQMSYWISSSFINCRFENRFAGSWSPNILTGSIFPTDLTKGQWWWFSNSSFSRLKKNTLQPQKLCLSASVDINFD